MTNYVYIATSLDGFIADRNGGLSWLNDIPNPEGSDYGFAEFMKGIDAIVMGRRTFEVVLTFDSWPYEKPVFVMSRRGVEIPRNLENKVEVVNTNPKSLIENLRERGLNNLYIDGGITIQSFLRSRLIDEMIITRVPILLGGGIPLFGELSQKLHFNHEETEVLNDMLVKSHYKLRQ